MEVEVTTDFCGASLIFTCCGPGLEEAILTSERVQECKCERCPGATDPGSVLTIPDYAVVHCR